MVDHKKLKMQLINGAIKAVSIYGFEGFTTRSIGQMCNIKDAYIYRYFQDKEDLAVQSFNYVYNSLMDVLISNILIFDNKKISLKQRCYNLWDKLWEFLVCHPDEAKYFIRFFYSTYFTKYSKDSFKTDCNNLERKFLNSVPEITIFKVNTAIFIEVLYTIGYKIAEDEIKKCKENSKMLFKILYTFLEESNQENNFSSETGKLSYLQFYKIVNSWIDKSKIISTGK